MSAMGFFLVIWRNRSRWLGASAVMLSCCFSGVSKMSMYCVGFFEVGKSMLIVVGLFFLGVTDMGFAAGVTVFPATR